MEIIKIFTAVFRLFNENRNELGINEMRCCIKPTKHRVCVLRLADALALRKVKASMMQVVEWSVWWLESVR